MRLKDTKDTTFLYMNM